MERFALGLVSGGILCLFLPSLPAFFYEILLLSIGLYRFRTTLPQAHGLFGLGSGVICFCLHFWLWQWQLPLPIPAPISQRALPAPMVTIGGVVLNCLVATNGQRIELDVQAVNGRKTVTWLPYRVFGYSELPCEQWRQHRVTVTAVVKPLRVRHNRAQWPDALLSFSHYRVARLTQLQLVSATPLQGWRSQILAGVSANTANLPTQGLVLALLFGDKSLVADDDALLLRQLNLAHLFVVSGLHIGLVAALCWWMLGSGLPKLATITLTLFDSLRRLGNAHPRGRRLKKSPHRPKRNIAHGGNWSLVEQTSQLLLFRYVLSAVLVLSYGYLCQYSAATLRACLLFLLWAAARSLAWRVTSWQLWSACLLLVVLLMPMSVMSVGFYLSFTAVAILLLAAQWRWLTGPFWLVLLRVQLLLWLLLTPVTLTFFSGLSAFAVLANLLMVPVVTLLVMPLLLLALLCTLCGGVWLVIANWCWSIADSVLGWSLSLLTLVTPSANAMPIWHIVPWLDSSLWLLVLVMLVMVFSKLCSFTAEFTAPQSLLAVPIVLVPIVFALTLLLLPVWLASQPQVPETITPSNTMSTTIFATASSNVRARPWSVTVFDVGHGLAVLLERGRQSVLYDTGSGNVRQTQVDSVLLPYLRAQHSQLQGWFISHQDNDHNGGAARLATLLPNRGQLNRDVRCAGQSWALLGLAFDGLWPATEQATDNANSCVLLVSDGRVSVLLTGDLPAAQEQQLLALWQNDHHIQAKLALPLLLVSPHHGSASSSQSSFVAKLAPRWVVHSNGQQNRFALPSMAVVARYHWYGATQWATGSDGQVKFVFGNNERVKMQSERSGYRFWWQMFDQ